MSPQISHFLKNGSTVHPSNIAVKLGFVQWTSTRILVILRHMNNILKFGSGMNDGKNYVLTTRVRMELWMSLGTIRTSVSAIFVCVGMASIVTAPFYQSATAMYNGSTANFLLSYMEINKWCGISLELSTFKIFSFTF